MFSSIYSQPLLACLKERDAHSQVILLQRSGAMGYPQLLITKKEFDILALSLTVVKILLLVLLILIESEDFSGDI